MTQPSNFTSYFGGITPIDLMSTTSSNTTCLLTNLTPGANPNSYSYKGNYIYIGDLLIQFTNINYNSGFASSPAPNGNNYTFTFPIPYSTIPYGIFLSSYNTGATGDGDWTSFSISNITTSDFTFRIGNFSCVPQFIVIGPKP